MKNEVKIVDVVYNKNGKVTKIKTIENGNNVVYMFFKGKLTDVITKNGSILLEWVSYDYVNNKVVKTMRSKTDENNKHTVVEVNYN